MSYNLITKVPSAEDLLNLSKAGVNVAEYMRLISKCIDAEVETNRANVAQADEQKEKERVQNLRLLYGMVAYAPDSLVTQYVDYNDLPNSKLFPIFSKERQKLEDEEGIETIRQNSGYPDLPDSVFLSAVNGARKHGIPLENVKISIHIVDEDFDFETEDRFNPLSLAAALGALRAKFA